MHPAAPQGLHDQVEAFAQTVQAVIDLAHGCSADDLALPTDCPGWTVHDQISHVTGVEAWLEGRQDPRVTLRHYEHIRNELGRKVEHAVEVRRGRSGAEVVAELEDVLAQRLSTLRDPTLTDSSVIAGPFGPDLAATVVLMRTFDVWAHEQDIRTALGRPGNLDSPAAAVFVGLVLLQLPKLIVRGADLEPGQCVVIDVTGPLVASEGVRVVVDGHGQPRGHPVTADPPPDGYPTTTISLSTEAFTRRVAGRRTARDTVSDPAYSVVGDEAIARRVLEALVITH
jgi:uncharacterized protein (TIGR03083 family)